MKASLLAQLAERCTGITLALQWHLQYIILLLLLLLLL